MTNLINIKTGEVLDIDASDDQLSEAYKEVKLEMKKLEKIADALQEAIMDRLHEGQKQYGDFWQVQEQNRYRLEYPDKATEKEVKSMIENIEKEYRKPYTLTILKFPKF
jgi:hypothetical protein